MGKIKILMGVIFLFLGLIIIIYPLFLTYQIIQNGKGIPQIFKVQIEEKRNFQKNKSNNETIFPQSEKEMEERMQSLISEQIGQLLPEKDIKNLLNLIAWSILSAIFIFGGSQLSQIGIKLIKS